MVLSQLTVDTVGKSEVSTEGSGCVANILYTSLAAGGGILLDMSKFMA